MILAMLKIYSWLAGLIIRACVCACVHRAGECIGRLASVRACVYAKVLIPCFSFFLSTTPFSIITTIFLIIMSSHKRKASVTLSSSKAPKVLKPWTKNFQRIEKEGEAQDPKCQRCAESKKEKVRTSLLNYI